MKIVLLGAQGQLGQQLRRSLGALGDVLSFGRDAPPAGGAQAGGWSGDLMQTQAMQAALAQLRPGVIVNAAAFSAVDRAELEPQAAYAVNASACGVLATSAQQLGARLVHFSTDYVFGGSQAGASRPWREHDVCAPLNVYGHSKFAGEQAIARSGCRYWILRTAWLYESASVNFLSQILQAALVQSQLQVVSDQVGAPTRAAWLADAVAQMLGSPLAREDASGIFHLTAAGQTNWHAYAVQAIAWALEGGAPLQCRPERVLPIPSVQRPGAKRPLNSRLDCTLAEDTFGIARPQWQSGVRAVVQQWVAALPAQATGAAPCK